MSERRVEVLVAYDMSGDKGRFRAQMIALGWKYQRKGKELRRSTCWTQFDCLANETLAEARDRAAADTFNDLQCCETNINVTLKESETGVKLERWYVVAFEEAHATIDQRD